jgi:hypothetical protein
MEMEEEERMRLRMADGSDPEASALAIRYPHPLSASRKRLARVRLLEFSSPRAACPRRRSLRPHRRLRAEIDHQSAAAMTSRLCSITSSE